MQVLDDRKRQTIQRAASRLFAERPYHQVRLDDVAAIAGVGKGTVYTYFDSKHDLYLSLIDSGLTVLIKQLKDQLTQPQMDAMAALRRAVDAVTDFAYANPQVYELIRTASLPIAGTRLEKLRRELSRTLEQIIRRGVADGVIRDPHPELTAQFVPGMVRAVIVHGEHLPSRRVLVEHVMRLLRGGLSCEQPS
jgi:AcrR family transcriptional regulator